jgi:hypothetical protein
MVRRGYQSCVGRTCLRTSNVSQTLIENSPAPQPKAKTTSLTGISSKQPTPTMDHSDAVREEPLAVVARINAAAEALSTAEAHEAIRARQGLFQECKTLIASFEDPDAAVWPRAFQVNVAVAIDVAATLGVWETLRSKKVVTLSEVVDNKKADAETIGPFV